MTSRIKVFSIELNVPMQIKVLAELSAQHGWETIYCVSKDTEHLVKQYFPNAIYHDTHHARYGRPAPGLSDLPWVSLDQPTAEAIGYAEIIALKQTDRLAIMGGFSMDERFRHFHRVFSYWSAVLDRMQPDVVIMPTAPHSFYDYVIYLLAKRRGIRTIMFEYVTTEGMLMAIDGFEDGLPPLTAAYRKLLANPPKGPVVLSDRMEDYLRRLQGNYDRAMPLQTREMFERGLQLRAEEVEADRARAENDAEIDGATDTVRLGDRILARFGLQRIAAAPDEAPDAPRSRPPATDGHFEGRFYAESEVPEELAYRIAEHRRLHIQKLIGFYDELAVDMDPNRPFVYVPLHLQPERATNPNGGMFDDQYVMVGMIASVLPPDWLIYVKEHPNQLLPQMASERGRWLSHYEALVAFPNVRLVRRDTVTFDLIDKARAVASIVGTALWEAIVRRTPALVFGEPWYKGCPGSYTVRTTEDCRQALERILAGERPDPAATRLFLKAAEDAAFVGYICSDDEPVAGIDEETNVQRMTKAIVDCYRAAATEKYGDRDGCN